MSGSASRAVVTGAASGIGRAIALALADAGTSVVACDVRPIDGDLRRLPGVEVVVADLAETLGRQRLIDTVRQESVHHLVNAAAILAPKAIADVTVEDFRRVTAVNLESTWFLCRDVGSLLEPGGSILNFSSPSARWPHTVEAAVYGMTKLAIQGITRTFAIVYAGRGIRVNAIAPGITDTPMQEQLLRDVARIRGLSYQRLAEERSHLVPLDRSATPAEIAKSALWLLSDAASYITGQCIYVDGGYVMSA